MCASSLLPLLRTVLLYAAQMGVTVVSYHHHAL